MCEKVNTKKTGWGSGGTFSDAYESFHPVVRKEIYRKIMEWTEWSKYTFYAKKNGVHPLKPLEAKIIDLIFKKYGVDAWTGEEIEATV
jgi:hypothetical protein